MNALVGNGIQKLQAIQKRIETTFDDAIKQSSPIEPDRNQRNTPTNLSKTSESTVAGNHTEGELSEQTVRVQSIVDSLAAKSDLTDAQRVISDLRRENDSLLAEGTRLARRLGVVEDRYREKLRQLELLSKEKVDLEVHIRESEAQIARIACGSDDKLSQNREIADDAKLIEYGNKVANLQNSLINAEEERILLLSSNQSLIADLEKLRSQHKEEVESLECLLTQVRQEIEDIKDNELSSVPQGPLIDPGAFESLTHALNQRLTDLESEKLCLRSQMNSLECNLQQARDVESSRSAVIRELEGTVAQQTADIDVLNHENANLRERIGISEAARRELLVAIQSDIDRKDRDTDFRLLELSRECERLREECQSLRLGHSIPKSGELGGCLGDIGRKFEMALQAIGKLQDELDATRLREEALISQISKLSVR